MIGNMAMSGVPRVSWEPAKTKIIADGNSFFANITYVQQLQFVAPLSSKFTIQNLGIGGQTFRKMNGLDGGSRTDIDAALVTDKLAVLLITEITNSAALGRTQAQIIQDATDYNATTRAKAAELGTRLKIVGSTSIPREAATDAETLALNQLLSACDAHFLANYKAMGYDAMVDVRTGTRFDFIATQRSDFDAIADLAQGTEGSGIWVHPNGAGAALMAAKWTPVLKSLRIK